MTDDQQHQALARIARDTGSGSIVDVLASLSGADLTTVLLEVASRRSAALTPARVLQSYERDRFTRPSTADPRRMVALELAAIDAVAVRFTTLCTAPLVPLGTHSTVAGVHQNRVVTTVRNTEVAADPTNTLALEAAVRRRHLLARDSRSAEVVHLAAVERVVRAQQFDGPRSFAHFSLLGLVSAGRDIGSHQFEQMALQQHLEALVHIVRDAGFTRALIRLTDFGGHHADVLDTCAVSVADIDIDIVRWPERPSAGAYYPGVCCKLSVFHEGEEVEVGDGGFVNWTERLVGSRKERLMISGLSLERLLTLA